MSIQSCFALAFDLQHRQQLDRPFAARLDIGVEPTDILKFYDVYTGRPTDSNIPGMVQLNAFTPFPDTFIEEGWMSIWRKARETASLNGFPNAAVGILIVSKSSGLICTYALMIQQRIIDYIRQTPKLTNISAVTGQTTEQPLDVAGCMEYAIFTVSALHNLLTVCAFCVHRMMNKHIRADTKNLLSLRTEMTESDIKTIRDAAVINVHTTRPANWGQQILPPPQMAASILKEKMLKETLYKSAYGL